MEVTKKKRTMPELETVAILVPVDLEAGDLFKVTLEWGATFTIQVPEGSTGGDTIAVDLPTFESVAAEIDELDSVVRQPSSNHRLVQGSASATDHAGLTQMAARLC